VRVLVACEFSGVVRDAFASRGHDAWSCDVRPTEREGQHYHGSILDVEILQRGWDLMIAHPDCTFLTVSGNRWFNDWRVEARLAALHFVRALWAFPIPHIAIENPIGVLSTVWKRPDQVVEPFHFGDPFKKATCLWLKNLPPLVTTNNLGAGKQACWLEPPSPQRKMNRSRTYQGIATAMAEQWGAFLEVTP
jgi:hypothetical protein